MKCLALFCYFIFWFEGDKESGKTRLKERMQGVSNEDAVATGLSVEFDFIDVRDPDNPNGGKWLFIIFIICFFRLV
jgi:hypothetical protein